MKKFTKKALLLTASNFIVINNVLAMDFYHFLATNNPNLVSRKLMPVYYAARGLKNIHNNVGNFAVGFHKASNNNLLTINPHHEFNSNSTAFNLGRTVGNIFNSNTILIIPFILSFINKEATNSVLSWIYKKDTDIRTLFPDFITYYLTLAAGLGTAYWLSKDAMDVCGNILMKDRRFSTEMHAAQPSSSEYNLKQLNKLEFFNNKYRQDPKKIKKIKTMLVGADSKFEPYFKTSKLSYSQKIANKTLLNAAIGNENHNFIKIINFFGNNTVNDANEAKKSFNMENCMICQEEMNDYKNLTDFSCNFHSIHQDCFNNAQKEYYKGKSNPDKRRCLICTPN